jgi:hypothetical protein
MRIRILAISTLIALAGCKPDPNACGPGVCTGLQRCTLTKVCVTDLPPVLTVTDPTGTGIISIGTIEVKGTAKDDNLPPTVDMSLDESTWTEVALDADGTFSAQFPLPSLDNAGARLVIRARDSKGHEVKETRTMLVDNVAPTCAISDPVDGAIISAKSTVTVTLAAADGSHLLSSARISIDGATTFTTLYSTPDGYAFALPVAAAENGLARQLVFRIEDGVGHLCEARALVTIDNVAPTVAFSSPDAGALLGPGFFASGGTFSGSASDGTRSLKSVTLDFDDGAGARIATVQAGTWTLSVPAPTGDDFKSHNLKVVATDQAGNMTSASRTVVVDMKAPSLVITFPAANAKINIANFSSGNELPLTLTLTDGDPQLIVGLALPDGGSQSALSVTTSPTDNPTVYKATVIAKDHAGNSSMASVTFSVDRVAPAVQSFSPVNNTRMHIGPASIEFTEPIQTDAGFGLAPAVNGSWTTSQRYQVPDLKKDTVYTATFGGLTDLSGNSVVDPAWRFHTETWTPDSGATLEIGYAAVAAAVADPEGALSLIASATDGGVNFLQLDSATGSPHLIRAFTMLEDPRLLSTWRTILPDLSSRRQVGVTYSAQGVGDHITFKLGSGPVQETAGDLFIPTPAFPGEGTGLGEFGWIYQNSYHRQGAPDVPVLVFPDEAHFTRTRWDIIGYGNAGGFSSQSFGYSMPLGGYYLCEMSGLKSFVSSLFTPIATAASSTCSMQEIAGQTRMFKWQPGCGGTGLNSYPCAYDSMMPSTPGFDSMAADLTNDDNSFYAVVQTSSGYQMLKAALDGNCYGVWTYVGSAIPSAQFASAPRVVVLRGVAGLVFTDPSNHIKFVAP